MSLGAERWGLSLGPECLWVGGQAHGSLPPRPRGSLTCLLQTANDILTTVVRSTKPPLSQLLICQAFPAVAQCTLHTDDNATMQVPPRGCPSRGHEQQAEMFPALEKETPPVCACPEDPEGSGC